MEETIDDLVNGIEEIDRDLSQGHVSVQEASTAVNDINNTWDEFAGNMNNNLGIDLGRVAVDTFGQETFDAFGGIKQGASNGISSVSSFFDAIDSFDGSWRNPAEARQRLQKGLMSISAGITQLGNTIGNIERAGKAISNALGIGNPIIDQSTGKPIIDSITGKPILHHPILDGIGTFGVGLSGFGTAFAQSGMIEAAGDIAEDISRAVNGDPVVQTAGTRSLIDPNRSNPALQKNETVSKPAENFQNSTQLEETEILVGKDNIESNSNCEDGSSVSSNVDNYSADMISEINVVLDGSSSSQNSLCTINGNEYRLSSYSLSQELLQPMILSFSIEKEDKTETNSDVIFSDSTNIIGKSLEIHVSTIKTSLSDEDSSSQKAFVFKGMIIDVSASRTTASTQSASVTVATWDALLQNAPHCRSFENRTLKDIIESVLKPYSDIKYKISPRFKDKIPYIVQYNQSDYAFISMLAVRFGEWMYNTGDTFIFGEIEDSGSSANLEYPGGSLMSYNLHQSMTSFMFNHLLPDYYQYGKEKAILKESAQGIADGAVNNWTDKAFNASMQRFKNEQIAALNAGGFDSGKEDEGSDSILDYSLKIEAEGKKTGIMTVHGFSKLAMLKIGQTFLIRDNVQNKSGESKDVEQKALKVIGINHSFDYRQEYSNSFTAIPIACNYPSYSDADVFPSAPQQRAKVVENKDEQKLGRIRVQFPWQEIQSKEMKTPWLRIAVPYAGASKGHQFIPEIGEEVMVGFEMNNAERPYIIGSFYNGGNGKPDEEWAASKDDDGTNTVKAIRTRNGHTIEIHDKGNDGYIRIYDNKKENYILTFSTDEKLIKLESTGNIELYAKNDIIMQAGHDIKVQAGHDRNTSVGRNDSLSVGSNQFVKIGANKDEQVANQLQVSAQNIRVEAGMSLNEYSTTHNINALAEVSITSTGPTNIKLKILKAI